MCIVDIWIYHNSGNFRVKKYSCMKCSRKKLFGLHDSLTRVQLCIACVENICLQNLTLNLSRITVIYTHVHVCTRMISCNDNACPIQVDFDDDKIDVSQLSFFDRDDDEAALTWKKKKT